MKTKQLFIISLILILALSLYLPLTKEHKYCDQFSGESDITSPSDNFKACQNEIRCKVLNNRELTTQFSDSNVISYSCISDKNVSEDEQVETSLFPK